MEASLRLLGKRIRAAREAKGLSQEDLAHRVEVGRSYIDGLEQGQRNPSFNTLFDIASTLDVELATLLRGLPVKR